MVGYIHIMLRHWELDEFKSFKAAAAVMPETDRTRLHVSIVSSNRRDSVNRLFFANQSSSQMSLS